MSGLNLTLKIWRQKDAKTKGQFETVKINDVSPDMSFLEMLDIVNEEQMKQGKEGFAFDHDSRAVFRVTTSKSTPTQATSSFTRAIPSPSTTTRTPGTSRAWPVSTT